MQWIKSCPECEELQIYATEKILKAAIRNNKLCRLCRPGAVGGGENNGMFGKNHSEETKKRIAENTRKHMKGTPKSLSQRKKMSLARSGAIHSPETIEKLKKPKTETHKEKLRKPKSEEAKQNMRVAARRRIQNNLGSLAVPNYNPRACKAIEELGNKLGYTFQHAMTPEGEFFINELFFWVDGYDS
jgi:hypothetical protein